jgi:hypothetical protein
MALLSRNAGLDGRMFCMEGASAVAAARRTAGCTAWAPSPLLAGWEAGQVNAWGRLLGLTTQCGVGGPLSLPVIPPYPPLSLPVNSSPLPLG